MKKTRILAVEALLRKTKYGITVRKIIEDLRLEYGIASNDKTVLNDIHALKAFHNVVRLKRGHAYYYRIVPDVKLQCTLFSCPLDSSGIKDCCCTQCNEYNKCANACINSPDKCGYSFKVKES